jgi:D-alanyl-D-alanine carboxypeptidase
VSVGYIAGRLTPWFDSLEDKKMYFHFSTPFRSLLACAFILLSPPLDRAAARQTGVNPRADSVRSVSRTPSALEVADYVKSEMKKRRIPGLSLAVLRDGRPLMRQAYGLASVELGVPATADTVYQLASTTKIFTGTAVMLLVEEGKLSLDDRVTKLLPGLPPAWRDITVRHCLTHTSGLPDVVLSDDTDEVLADTLGEALRKLAVMPLLSKPGEKWEYNQTGYVLLGMIIEKISGLSFEEFLADRFFRPLGMNATSFGDSREVVPHRSSLYSLYVLRDKKLVDSPDKIHATQFLYPEYIYTGAGLNTSVGDMAKWDAALSAGKILKPATLNAMWAATKLNDGTTFRLEGSTLGYGGGWLVDDTPGHKSVGHTGGSATAYIRYLDDKLSVIVLTNCQGARPEELAQGVAALYVPALAEENE